MLAQSALWQPTRSTKPTELEPSFELISQGAGLGTKQVLDFCGPRLHAGRCQLSDFTACRKCMSLVHQAVELCVVRRAWHVSALTSRQTIRTMVPQKGTFRAGQTDRLANLHVRYAFAPHAYPTGSTTNGEPHK